MDIQETELGGYNYEDNPIRNRQMGKNKKERKNKKDVIMKTLKMCNYWVGGGCPNYSYVNER